MLNLLWFIFSTVHTNIQSRRLKYSAIISVFFQVMTLRNQGSAQASHLIGLTRQVVAQTTVAPGTGNVVSMVTLLPVLNHFSVSFILGNHTLVSFYDGLYFLRFFQCFSWSKYTVVGLGLNFVFLMARWVYMYLVHVHFGFCDGLNFLLYVPILKCKLR